MGLVGLIITRVVTSIVPLGPGEFPRRLLLAEIW